MALSNAERQARHRARKKALKQANATPAKAPKATEGAAHHGDTLLAYDAARTRRMKAEAELSELNLAHRRGELVDKAKARARFGQMLANIRAALEALPARLAMRRPDLSQEDLDALRRELVTATRVDVGRLQGE